LKASLARRTGQRFGQQSLKQDASRLTRQFVTNGGFDFYCPLHRRARHHALMMRVEIGESAGCRLQNGRNLGQGVLLTTRVGTLPAGLAVRKSGLRISCLNDSGRGSKGTPISCRAMWTAIELEPGAK
jgi:hypothetical protein